MIHSHSQNYHTLLQRNSVHATALQAKFSTAVNTESRAFSIGSAHLRFNALAAATGTGNLGGYARPRRLEPIRHPTAQLEQAYYGPDYEVANTI